jgi:hypothetical protein
MSVIDGTVYLTTGKLSPHWPEQAPLASNSAERLPDSGKSRPPTANQMIVPH